MSSIYLLYENILEASTVTVTTENTDYPKWRLYDRDVGKQYRATGTANLIIKADQGAVSVNDIDTVIVADGHNLSGLDYDVDRSPDDAVWTNVATGTFGAGEEVIDLGSVLTYRYWRIEIKSPAAIPRLTEVFMGEKKEFADLVLWGYTGDGKRGNVVRVDSLSGIPHFLNRGEEREARTYTFRMRTSAHQTLMEDFLTTSRDKPFFLLDFDSAWYFMSLTDPNVGPLVRPTLNVYDIILDMIEVPA